MIYAFSFNPTMEFTNIVIHDFVKTSPLFNDWWHYQANFYFLDTKVDAKVIATVIRAFHPNLNFVIAKVDLNEYDGSLPQAGWDWLSRKSGKIRLKLKSNPTPVSPLSKILFPTIKPKPPEKKNDIQSLLDLLGGGKK